MMPCFVPFFFFFFFFFYYQCNASLRESQKWIKTNVKERKQSNLTNDSGQGEILATKQLLR
jgi:hypothetical protein